ncbi:MAG: glycosyltransferase [Bdellovibrionota bacterium]
MKPSVPRNVRVLMLGWEYPPRFAGGLGKACQGLSQAMARQGAQVFFVLPTYPERKSEPHLEVIGARECLIEAGYDLDEQPLAQEEYKVSQSYASTAFEDSSVGQITTIRADAQLLPYGAAPSGPMPEKIYKMLLASERVTHLRARIKRVVSRKGPTLSAPPMIPGAPKTPPQPKSKGAKPGSPEIYGRNLWSEIDRFASTVRHLSDAHEVDCVHAHDWMTFPAAFEFQKATGVPVFLHVHATEYDRSGENMNNEVFRIEREGFRRATHIFAVSRYTAGVIERLYGVSRKKISVVYNAPDEDEKKALAGAEVADRQSQVVFLGRLTFQKGPDHFLKAAALVSKAQPEARFILCGTGDMMDKLRAQSHRLGIESRTHFAGFVEPAGVDEILKHSRVLVMPSVSEPFGLVALEAIRCGIPVIISKQSGVREVLHRALQVDFWDHEKLADQIMAALRLPDLSRQLVEDGMIQVQALSWDKSAQKVISSYQRFMSSTYAQAIGGMHGH